MQLDPAQPLARAEWLVIGDAQGRRARADHRRWRSTWQRTNRWLGDRIERRHNPLERGRGTGRGAARTAARRDRAGERAGPAPDPRAACGYPCGKAWSGWGNCSPAASLPVPALPGSMRFRQNGCAAEAQDWLAPLLAGRRDLDLPRGALADARSAASTGTNASSSTGRAHVTSPRPPIPATPSTMPATMPRASRCGCRGCSVWIRHPMIGDHPAAAQADQPRRRPMQATRDLPGFWRGSWRDVAEGHEGPLSPSTAGRTAVAEKPSLKTKNAFDQPIPCRARIHKGPPCSARIYSRPKTPCSPARLVDR
jgi:ATP-dependent helicase HrpB